ncbi:MAG: hypothetical protein LBI95_00555 [Holosporales bacterium]|nr:hypothetical protein [Holosporales bacterium]
MIGSSPKLSELLEPTFPKVEGRRFEVLESVLGRIGGGVKGMEGELKSEDEDKGESLLPLAS